MIDLTQFNYPLKPFRSILCLDGTLPDQSLLTTLITTWQLPIVAADGSANKLMRMNIVPDIVIGDLDAIDNHLLASLRVLHLPDQNTCDYEKCLAYLAEKNLLPTIVCGVNGGDLDHILNNISIFVRSESVFYSNDMLGFVIREGETQEYTFPLNTKISLLGMPQACMTSKGLRWEMKDYVLQFPGQSACFNRTSTDTIQLTIHTGMVLVLVHD